MNIDKAHLEAEQKRLLAMRENLIAQVNACGGALEFIAAQLQHLAKPEPEKPEPASEAEIIPFPNQDQPDSQ